MDAVADGGPVVRLPERMDRRLRFGPFASARDALKFVTYAAVGAVFAPFTSPWVWVVVVALGFVISVYRPEGSALDEQAVAFCLWKLRSRPGERDMNGSRAHRTVHAGLLRLGNGQYVAMVRSGGTPSAYLPPVELARRFETFRDFLRSVRGGLAFAVLLGPMPSGPVVPAIAPCSGPDHEAAAGYTELVSVLCRRRSVRQVDVALRTEGTGAEGVADLELRVTGVIERLGGLGLRTIRLRRRTLEAAARRWGWEWRRTAE